MTLSPMLAGLSIVGVLLLVMVAIFAPSHAEQRGWCRGWRKGYDEGYEDCKEGRRPNPTNPSPY